MALPVALLLSCCLSLYTASDFLVNNYLLEVDKDKDNYLVEVDKGNHLVEVQKGNTSDTGADYSENSGSEEEEGPGEDTRTKDQLGGGGDYSGMPGSTRRVISEWASGCNTL